jgi:hypothetical protein
MATPQQYFNALALTPDGQAVLDELMDEFGGTLWAATDGDRARNIGRREVLEHIQAMLAQAEPIPRPR